MALTLIGANPFTQSGPARWYPSGWDLDRLIVPVQGDYTLLNAFTSSLTMWASSTIDGNMFLADYSVDGDKRFPTVDLIFIGKRNGVPTPVKTDHDSVEQAASFADQGSSGSVDISVSYKSRRYSASFIGRNRTSPTLADPPAVTFADVALVKIKHTGSYSISVPLLDLFIQQIVPETSSIELVPGQYYRNMITKTIGLLGASA